MDILIVDDSRTRHRKFRQGLIGSNVVHVSNAPDAIAVMQQQMFDAVFLDYDLHIGGARVSDHVEETGKGSHIVNWIIQSGKDLKPGMQIFVHSLNPKGVMYMVDMLRANGKQAHACAFVWDYPNVLQHFVNCGEWVFPENYPT